jgi:hypothetical protein
MYVALALLGLTLGGLTGWAIEHPHVSVATTSNQLDLAADHVGQFSLNPEV